MMRPNAPISIFFQRGGIQGKLDSKKREENKRLPGFRHWSGKIRQVDMEIQIKSYKKN